MNNFKVTWEIELKAENAVDAAHRAWQILRQPNSLSNVFHVHPENGEWAERVDLEDYQDTRLVEPH